MFTVNRRNLLYSREAEYESRTILIFFFHTKYDVFDRLNVVVVVFCSRLSANFLCALFSVGQISGIAFLVYVSTFYNLHLATRLSMYFLWRGLFISFVIKTRLNISTNPNNNNILNSRYEI